MPLQILNRQRRLRVPRKRLFSLLRRALPARRRRDRLVIHVVGDREIRRVNREQLGHDYATDSIAFPLGDPTDPPGQRWLGEVFVSADTAVREARRRGHGPALELCLYAVHGTLHLLGYDDHGPAERRKMRRREVELLGVDLRVDSAEKSQMTNPKSQKTSKPQIPTGARRRGA